MATYYGVMKSPVSSSTISKCVELVTCFPLEDDIGVCVLPRLEVAGNIFTRNVEILFPHKISLKSLSHYSADSGDKIDVICTASQFKANVFLLLQFKCQCQCGNFSTQRSILHAFTNQIPCFCFDLCFIDWMFQCNPTVGP